MHILIIPSWYPDETIQNDVNGIFFKELAEAYAAQGHKVSVLAHLLPFPLHPQKFNHFLSRKKTWELNEVQTYNLKFFNLSGYRHVDDSSSIKAAIKWFGKYIKKNGTPDFIHAHSTFNAGFIALEIKRKFLVPYILTEHGTWFLKTIPDADLIRSIPIFKEAKGITAVGTILANRLTLLYRLPKDKCKVISNILSLHFFEKSTPQLTSDEFIFLNIALDGQKKRRDILLAAFARVFKGNNDIKLWIGGTSNENEDILRLANELHIENQVKILGVLSRDEVKLAIAQCNVFTLSSDIETFGIVLIEALSQGKPVISTDSGGPKDIINKTNGILVPTNDVDSFANAMLTVKERYSEFDFDLIRIKCLNKYHPEYITRSYIELITQN